MENQQRSFLLNETNYKSSLLGCLIGDSSFEAQNGSVSFQHSMKNEDYLDFKYNEFSRFFNTGKNSVTVNKKCNLKDEDETRRGKIKRFRIYDTKKTNEFKKILLDSDGNRQLPNDLTLIKPISIFFWYLDDGSLIVRHPNSNYKSNNIRRSIRIALKSYSDESILKLVKYFEGEYDIHFKTESTKDRSKITRILMSSKEEIQKFLKIIEPFEDFCPTTMKYKLDGQFNN